MKGCLLKKRDERRLGTPALLSLCFEWRRRERRIENKEVNMYRGDNRESCQRVMCVYALVRGIPAESEAVIYHDLQNQQRVRGQLSVDTLRKRSHVSLHCSILSHLGAFGRKQLDFLSCLKTFRLSSERLLQF